MGKAATNERMKLRATFYNNVAVGATITGAIVPFLAHARELLQKDDEFTTTEMVVTLLVILAAATVAVACRHYADRVISSVQD